MVVESRLGINCVTVPQFHGARPPGDEYEIWLEPTDRWTVLKVRVESFKFERAPDGLSGSVGENLKILGIRRNAEEPGG